MGGGGGGLPGWWYGAFIYNNRMDSIREMWFYTSALESILPDLCRGLLACYRRCSRACVWRNYSLVHFAWVFLSLLVTAWFRDKAKNVKKLSHFVLGPTGTIGRNLKKVAFAIPILSAFAECILDR